jgi:AcrR family transcriptional regulator
MLDQVTPKGRILAAALECAAKKSWADVTLLDIAEAAKLPLHELRGLFVSKTDIIAALLRAVDDEVLSKAPARSEGQEKRDRLFDIVMTRFELMQPYKPALKRISSYLCCRPGEAALLLGSSLASQYWMLAGAGAKLDGAGGALRVTGLAAVYGKVFQVWLDDASPSLDKTMAALDKRLAKGERMLSGIETACEDVCRFACGFLPRGWKRGGAEAPAQPAPPQPV